MIRLAIIGLGGRACHVVRKILEMYPDIRVVGVLDPDRKGATERLPEQDRETAVFCESVDDLVGKTKPDGLMIGTRCNLHAPYAVEAAKYDIPLYLEKPVAVSMDQATALEQAFDGSRCEVVVSFPLRVAPLCMLAKEFLDRGAVGKTREHICATNYVPYGTVYWKTGYRNYEITQGLFLQKATHDFDYMTFLMDSPVVRVGAMANFGRVFGGNKPSGLTCAQCDEKESCLESTFNRRRPGKLVTLKDQNCPFSVDCGSPETGINEDCSSALIEFASGAHGVYTQVFFTRGAAARRGSVISGYDGTLEFDWYKNELRHVRHHDAFTETVTAGSGLSHFGGDQELVIDFVGLIEGRNRSRTPVETGIASAYACLAAKESAATGRFVQVRQLGGG